MSAVGGSGVDLTPCGNCGSDDVRMRARGSAGNAVQPYQFAVRVVEHLDLCRQTLEQHCGTAGEGFDVAGVFPLVDQGKQVFHQARFTARPRE